MRYLPRRAAKLRLFGIERLRDIVDRPAWHAARLERIDPSVARTRDEDLRQLRQQFRPVHATPAIGGETSIERKFRHVHRSAQRTKLAILAACDDHMSIARGEGLIRHDV